MVIRSVDLPYVCGVKSTLPKTGKPEFVLAGRSNVGKSSFINTLLQRKSFARTSSTPGKTRTINFYSVNDSFYLVDLPGYGYARASHAEREKWARMLESYLAFCPSLKALALLLDCRLPPQKLDKDLAAFARAAGRDLLPVLTKADKCKQNQRATAQRQWQDIVGIRPLLTSASARTGIDQLWLALMAVAKNHPADGGEG